MNEPQRPDLHPPDAEDDRSQGPNLMVIYSLIGLALLLAIGIAVWIVLPFYLRR